MRQLGEHEILDVWDLGRAQHPVDRALTLLALVHPHRERSELAALGIGERDEQLLELRECTFGDRLGAVARCPQCAADLELELRASQLRAQSRGDSGGVVEVEGMRVEFRVPNSYDMATVASAHEHQAGAVLLSRCVTSASNSDGALAAEDLPPPVVAALEEEMSQLSPPLERRFLLACPECGHGWESGLDIAAFLWAEIERAAQRLIHQVVTLARAFNWTERDVLALSPRRRRSYLELVQ